MVAMAKDRQSYTHVPLKIIGWMNQFNKFDVLRKKDELKNLKFKFKLKECGVLDITPLAVLERNELMLCYAMVGVSGQWWMVLITQLPIYKVDHYV